MNVCALRHLMVDPRQRKVIVAENPLMPTIIRKTICKVLFGNLQVSGKRPRLVALH